MKWWQWVLCVYGAVAVFVLVLRPFMTFREMWRRWMPIAHKIGVAMTHVMLTLLYFLIIPIFALIAGKKRLRLKLDPNAASYWEDVKPLPHTLEDAARPF